MPAGFAGRHFLYDPSQMKECYRSKLFFAEITSGVIRGALSGAKG